MEKNIKKKFFRKKILLIFAILIILISAWSFFIEPNFIKVEKVSLKIENLPSSFERVKIAHLTDFHSKNFGKKEKKVLKILDDLKPDYIFITGDIIDWKTNDLKSCQEFWKELDKIYHNKIFAVYGNHDHRNRKFKTFDKLFRESKIEVLNNQSKKISVQSGFFSNGKKNEDFVYLVGIDDPCSDYDNLDYNDLQKICYDNLQKNYHDNLQKTFKKIKDEKIPKILLAHSPEIFREVKNLSFKVDLTLVGHTHGGQVDIPFLVDLILPLKYDKKYKEGLFKENSEYLYVNRGIGPSFLPIRFNSFPEIALIEISNP